MIRYASLFSTKNECKSKLILKYFGEDKKENCGICSYCIGLKKQKIDATSIAEQIIEALQNSPLDSRSLEKTIHQPSNQVIFALQELLEQSKVEILPNNQYRLKK